MSFRERFTDFRIRHPGFLAAVAIVVLGVLAIDGYLIYKRTKYRAEIQRLRAGMSEFEIRRADAVLASEEKQLEVMVALIRRQARVDKEIHLSIAVDSAVIALEREGAVLRDMRVEIGPEKTVGTTPDTVRMTVPRGTRSVQRLLTAADGWEVPVWVYTDRGLPVPRNRVVKGALGPAAIVLEGGTVLYSMPTAGPLNDSSYVMPGAVRARPEDLQAITPNLARGTKVYFF
ncbi:MAG: hypothetical protein ACT4PJ_00960 [Gemmatimonadaceae bacterium]